MLIKFNSRIYYMVFVCLLGPCDLHLLYFDSQKVILKNWNSCLLETVIIWKWDPNLHQLKLNGEVETYWWKYHDSWSTAGYYKVLTLMWEEIGFGKKIMLLLYVTVIRVFWLNQDGHKVISQIEAAENYPFRVCCLPCPNSWLVLAGKKEAATLLKLVWCQQGW